jgi:hypothetical protein
LERERGGGRERERERGREEPNIKIERLTAVRPGSKSIIFIKNLSLLHNKQGISFQEIMSFFLLFNASSL